MRQPPLRPRVYRKISAVGSGECRWAASRGATPFARCGIATTVVLLGPACLTHRNVDATTAMSWFVYEINKFQIFARPCVRRRLRADGVVFHLGRSLADFVSETVDPRRHAICHKCSAHFSLRQVCGSASPRRGSSSSLPRSTDSRWALTCPRARRSRRNDSREDLLNAISLNSSIVNGARVVGPSMGDWMIGAVGVPMCFLLNGLSFIAVIAGLLFDAAAKIQTRDRRPRRPGTHGRDVLFSQTSTCAHDFVVVPGNRDFRLVIHGAHAGVCARCAGARRKRLRRADVGQWHRCVRGRLVVATYGHLFLPRRLALGGVWLFAASLFALALTHNFYVALAFLFTAGFGMLLFSQLKHPCCKRSCPMKCEGGSWACGRLFWRDDSAWKSRSGRSCALGGHTARIAVRAIICAASALVTLSSGIIAPNTSDHTPMTRPRISSGTIVCSTVFEVEKNNNIPKPAVRETPARHRSCALAPARRDSPRTTKLHRARVCGGETNDRKLPRPARPRTHLCHWPT